MHLQTPLAAVLLSCVALGQDAPSELRPIPTPFSSKPKAFQFSKPFLQERQRVANLKPSAPATSGVCSVPLLDVTPQAATAKMPTLGPNPDRQYAMTYVDPPAPPCNDGRDGKQQRTPDSPR
jgi:hypothetical protein